MLKIACLGPEGSFSHEFALARFPGAVFVFADDFAGVLHRALDEGCDAAAIPFLNSSGVQVRPAQKAIAEFAGRLWVTGAFKHEVIHNLVVTDACRSVERIVSKEQVFPQCADWLGEHLPGAEHVHASSTSFALTELLASDDGTQSATAVICNQFAVDTYGGLVRNRGIQNPNNFTIFLTLSPKRPAPADRVLVTVACPDSDCYEASVDRFARRGCPMMFSSLVGEFSPEVPTFVEILVPPHVDAEKLIRFECDASNGVRRFVGSFAADESISDCVSSFFR